MRLRLEKWGACLAVSVVALACMACGGGGDGDVTGSDVAADAPGDVAAFDANGDGATQDVAERDSTGDDALVDAADFAQPGDSGDAAAVDGSITDNIEPADSGNDLHGGDAVDDVFEQCDPVIFDMAMIQDASTINCVFDNHRTTMKDAVLVDVWDVSYTSWESINCRLTPITIHGYASKPVAATENVPGIVHAHGLGGCADPDNATGPAALLGYFVIAPTGPGGGPTEQAPQCAASEGLSSGYDSGRRMFDTIPDPRGSWFWAHSVAAMRGLTCLASRAEVDDDRMGITGFSAGGVATLISAAVDPRVRVAVPLSGTGAWGEATQSANAWQHSLLSLAGYDTSSPEWQTLISTILPDVNMSGSTAKIMMVNGSSDEFFPLTAHMATYNTIPGGDKRTAIVANYDHGCCVLVDNLCGMEDKATIEARATLGAKGNQKAWFHHWFGMGGDFGYYPTTPEVSKNVIGAATYVLASVDGGGSDLDVESVKIWASNDGAMNFFSQELGYNDTLHMWDATVPVVIGDDAVYFVEVIYTNGAIIAPDRFLLTSLPHLPAGFVPAIHPIDGCVS